MNDNVINCTFGFYPIIFERLKDVIQEGHSVDEIAHHLKTTVGVARVMCRRAVKRNWFRGT